ncbi:hypothetical protein, conserved [Babesia ovata]|uniref:6-Cys domain-containing protein n=1 Tax=Babesia ovata TaxID=189622 RepID=A0A2H6KFG8_9APIC|nr:uncharacterized protein BOVATA_032340 [Babesia ovata]GBE61741.1 hypothetical protein, conserved [Babesia ovata]
MDMDAIQTATVVCPNRVNDTEYIWHPQSTSDERDQINTYVDDNGSLRSAALSDVMHSQSGNQHFSFLSNDSQTELHYKKNPNQLIAMTERRLIFICGPRAMVLSDALQRHLHRLDGFAEMQEFPWVPSTPLTQEISKIGNGLGVVFLNRGRQHLPLQGCGSSPSPLFAPDNEVTVDPVTGTRSCVANPMSLSPIGFLCEGRIEPADCMRSLLDKNGGVVVAPPPHLYWNFHNYGPWMAARYFNDLAIPMFTGECRCIDPETGHVKAKIEIRPQTEYVCDISSLIERHRANPINGPWCSVVLHPGSTLTIRFPTADVDSVSNDATQLLPTDQFEAEFLPKDLTTLRQLKTTYDFDVYEEISYNEALAGDALEMDVSQMAQGEVKLKYHADKPLALKGGHNSFLYQWRLKSTNEDVPDKIRAIVKVVFALTHPYHIIGSDRGLRSVFDPKLNKRYCSTKSMGNDIGNTYECSYFKNSKIESAGIFCRSDEKLLPTNCDSTGYDRSSNRVMPFPGSVRNATPYPIQGFQVFDIDLNGDNPVSYACVCVDQRGYETSRLILEHNTRQLYAFPTYRRKTKTHWLLGDVSRDQEKVGLLLEVSTRARPIMFKHKPKKAITLNVGTTLSMTCDLDPNEQNVANNKVIPSAWWPKEPDTSYYTIKQTEDGPQLFSKRYTDSIASTTNDFRITYNIFEEQGFERVTIESNKGAILVSKDAENTKFVPITFVCGKLLEPMDVGVITGKIYVSPYTHIVESSQLYAWHVVEVNVETTDPYMQGCGVTYEADELFKPETPKLYDADGQPQFGCKIDLQAAKEAAFYCPAPYVLDPPNCFSQVLVDGEVRNISGLSQSLVASHSNHFVILGFDSSLVGPGETLHQTPPLQCRCVTVKGIVLSTIQIENYYAK